MYHVHEGTFPPAAACSCAFFFFFFTRIQHFTVFECAKLEYNNNNNNKYECPPRMSWTVVSTYHPRKHDVFYPNNICTSYRRSRRAISYNWFYPNTRARARRTTDSNNSSATPLPRWFILATKNLHPRTPLPLALSFPSARTHTPGWSPSDRTSTPPRARAHFVRRSRT